MRCKEIFIFVFAVLIIGLVSASYEFSQEGSNVISVYQVNETLEAYLNISFSNEPINATFSDSLGNSIGLEELLELDDNYDTIFDDLTNTTVTSAFQILSLTEAGFKIDHQIGNITYKVSLDGEEVFEVTVQILSNNNLIEKRLKDKYEQLNNSKEEIGKQDPFVQSILYEFLNISEIETKLNDLETMYGESSNNEQYTEILNNLSEIKIPVTISDVVNTDSIRFYPSQENVDLDVLADIGGGSYGNKRQEYLGSIYNWNDQNLKTTLTFREVAINYDVNDQVNLRIFRFEFDKTQMNGNAYFIVNNLQNIKFEDDSALQMQESSYGYLYTTLSQIPNTITFSTTQDVDFLNVPAFISPSLSSLKIPEAGGWSEWIDNSRTKWILFAVAIIIILLIGAITYILIHVWYRKRYEAHLFKTRNNLFNIMTYIQNAKKKGMPRDEIIKNLKKAGWTGEQISYAMRKYEGKKILGLVRMPLNLTPETEKKPDLKKSPASLGTHPPIHKPFGAGPHATTNMVDKPAPVMGTPPNKNPIAVKNVNMKQNPPILSNKPPMTSKPPMINKPFMRSMPPKTVDKPAINKPSNVNPAAVKKTEQNNQNKNTKV